MNLRQTHFPYCLQKTATGKYILLNRQYKPIGSRSDAFVTYEGHPDEMRIKVSSAVAIKLSWNDSEAVDCIYLYNDGCNPSESAAHMNAYLKRLSDLAGIQHQDD